MSLTECNKDSCTIIITVKQVAKQLSRGSIKGRTVKHVLRHSQLTEVDVIRSSSVGNGS